MNQLLVSYRSVEAEFTSIQATSQQQNLAVAVRGNKQSSNLLNPQERQIVDDVDISDAALQKLEEAQILAKQLQEYLNYLKGKKGQSLPRITVPSDDPDVVIAGRSTNLSASITVGSIKEETLEISASFDDEGNIKELSVTKTQISSQFIQAEIILEDRQFYARG